MWCKISARLGVVISCLVALTFLSACQITGTSGGRNDQPIPSWVSIEKPGANVAPKIARFSGAWKGRIPRNRNVAVVITHIDSQNIRAIYSYGYGANTKNGYVEVDMPLTKKGDSIQFGWGRITITLSPGDTPEEVELQWEKRGFKLGADEKLHANLRKFALSEHDLRPTLAYSPIEGRGEPPFPPERFMTIDVPGENVPKNIARFSGIWVGGIPGVRMVGVAIYNINGRTKTAELYYSLGSNPSSRIRTTGGWSDRTAHIIDDTLVFSWYNRKGVLREVILEYNAADDTVLYRFQRKGRVTVRAKLRRKK